MPSLACGEWGQHGALCPHLSPSIDSDGAGRSGTYILIDMVLNKMAKGKTQSGAALLWLRARWGCHGNLGAVVTEILGEN